MLENCRNPCRIDGKPRSDKKIIAPSQGGPEFPWGGDGQADPGSAKTKVDVSPDRLPTLISLVDNAALGLPHSLTLTG
jgi:hypothetical protein